MCTQALLQTGAAPYACNHTSGCRKRVDSAAERARKRYANLHVQSACERATNGRGSACAEFVQNQGAHV